jgi:hypothetical protein
VSNYWFLDLTVKSSPKKQEVVAYLLRYKYKVVDIGTKLFFVVVVGSMTFFGHES